MCRVHFISRTPFGNESVNCNRCSSCISYRNAKTKILLKPKIWFSSNKIDRYLFIQFIKKTDLDNSRKKICAKLEVNRFISYRDIIVTVLETVFRGTRLKMSVER